MDEKNLDTVSKLEIDLKLDEPNRRRILTALYPRDIRWSEDGQSLFVAHIGGLSDSNLSGYGTARRIQMRPGYCTNNRNLQCSFPDGEPVWVNVCLEMIVMMWVGGKKYNIADLYLLFYPFSISFLVFLKV